MRLARLRATENGLRPPGPVMAALRETDGKALHVLSLIPAVLTGILRRAP
jgi:hypothetical protein